MIRNAKQEQISLRISVTDLCQLRCTYCMPSEGVPKLACNETLSFEEILRLVRLIKSEFGLTKVHITGGEPLVRPGIVDLVAMLSSEGIDDLALTTNGQELTSMASYLKVAGLQRVNISLDTLKPELFKRLTRIGELTRTLEGIDAAIECGFSTIKLNMVVLEGVNNGEIVDMASFGIKKSCQVRFLELMPIGPTVGRFDDWFVSSEKVYTELAKAFELAPVSLSPGGSSRNFIANDRNGREGIIGFISSHTVPFCRNCRRLRITSTGQLIGCLALGEGPNIRSFLKENFAGDNAELIRIINSALCLKRTQPNFKTTNPMVKVGG